mmetsp:Transcript_5818/g.21216  ORF Transcript_5818/g.21216 Transcript_5818/m.21216 type:complete len:234 (+) Transcript_5818:80-781(+)
MHSATVSCSARRWLGSSFILGLLAAMCRATAESHETSLPTPFNCTEQNNRHEWHLAVSEYRFLKSQCRSVDHLIRRMVPSATWKKWQLWLSSYSEDVQVVNTCTPVWKSYDVNDIVRGRGFDSVGRFAPSAPRAAWIGIAARVTLRTMTLLYATIFAVYGVLLALGRRSCQVLVLPGPNMAERCLANLCEEADVLPQACADSEPSRDNQHKLYQPHCGGQAIQKSGLCASQPG